MDVFKNWHQNQPHRFVRMNNIVRRISRNEVLPRNLQVPKKDLTKYSKSSSLITDTKKIKKKIPNLVIRLKNERFLVTQNKIEMINNNALLENNNQIKCLNGEKLSESVCGTSCLETEASKLLQDVLKSNKEILSSNVCSSAADEDNIVDEFHISTADLASLPRNLDQLEKEVYDGLSIFDKVDELEEFHVLEVPSSFSSYRSKGERKINAGLKVLYDCRSCNKVFMTWHELNAHEQEHEKTIVCEICDKSFRKENYLESHKDIHKCCICGQYGQLVGTRCKSCDGIKISSIKSMSKRMKESKLWRQKAIKNLNRFLLKNRSYYK